MAEYEELIELGFEGLDKFADKYHDNVYGWLPRRPRLFRKDERQEARRGRGQQGQAKKSTEDGSRRNERSGNDEDDGEGDEDEDEEEFEEAGPNPYGHANDYTRRRNETPYGGAYGAAQPRPPSPPYGYGQRPSMDGSYRGYAGEMREDIRRQQRQQQRRASSYSPPRYRRYSSPERQRRYSKSPDDDRVTPTIMGALAGGLIGGAARRGSVLSTVGGAVVGGIAAREGDRLFDQFEERRERRRRREYGHGR